MGWPWEGVSPFLSDHKQMWKFWPIKNTLKRAKTVFLDRKTPFFAGTQKNHEQLTARGVVERGFNPYGLTVKYCIHYNPHAIFSPFWSILIPFWSISTFIDAKTPFLALVGEIFWGERSTFSVTPPHFLASVVQGYSLGGKKSAKQYLTPTLIAFWKKNWKLHFLINF